MAKRKRYDEEDPEDQEDFTRLYGEQPQLEPQYDEAPAPRGVPQAPWAEFGRGYGRPITQTPDDAVTIGTSGRIIPPAEVRQLEGRTTAQDAFNAEYQRQYADRLRFFQSQGHGRQQAAALAHESAAFRARDTLQQQASMQQARQAADQFYGTANGGRPDLSGANAPNQGDFTINTLRGGRAGHTDFEGGRKVNDYQPGYRTAPQIIPEKVVWAGGRPHVIAPRQVIPGYNVAQQGYAGKEERDIAEAKARGELAPSERADLNRYRNGLAQLDKDVANGIIPAELVAEKQAELMSRINSFKLRDQIMQEENHKRAETQFQRQQALLNSVDVSNRQAEAMLIEQGHTLVKRPGPGGRMRFFSVDPKSKALTEVFGNDDEEKKAFEHEHAAWLKHNDAYLRAWDKLRKDEEKRNDKMVDDGTFRKLTPQELDSFTDRNVRYPKPPDEPIPPWLLRQQRQAGPQQQPQPGQPPTAPGQPDRPFTPGNAEQMSPGQKAVIGVFHQKLVDITDRQDIAPEQKAVFVTAIHDTHALLAKYGWLVDRDGQPNPALAKNKDDVARFEAAKNALDKLPSPLPRRTGTIPAAAGFLQRNAVGGGGTSPFGGDTYRAPTLGSVQGP